MPGSYATRVVSWYCSYVLRHSNNLCRVGSHITTALSIDFSASDSSKGFAPHSSFSSFQTSLRLEGSLFLAVDETNAIRVLDVDSGRLMYVLRLPLFHADPGVNLKVSPQVVPH